VFRVDMHGMTWEVFRALSLPALKTRRQYPNIVRGNASFLVSALLSIQHIPYVYNGALTIN